MTLTESENMENNYIMEKGDSDLEFEYQQPDLERLLNVSLEKLREYEAGPDYKTTDNKFGIELSVVAFRDIGKEFEELEENVFKCMEDDDVICDDKIANEIDPKLRKALIVSYVNNKGKLKSKIIKEMHHFSKNNFEYALIVLNCKYFMYESLFSDCKDALREIGLSFQNLIGVVIVYLEKMTTNDSRHSLTPNVLIRNPHCNYQPFQITENFKIDFKSKPTKILFEMSGDIFNESELYEKIRKFMIRNKYWDESINITVNGIGSNKQFRVTENNKEIPCKRFEKPRCDNI